MRRNVLIVGLLCLVTALPTWAVNTGEVVMQNGDTITGEFKSLVRGQLSYSTDNLGTLTINWDSVATLVDTKVVVLQMTDGTIYQGVMEQPTESGKVALRTEEGLSELAMDEIYEMNPLVKSYWKGLKGSFSLGASYTKSADTLQLSASVDISKRHLKSYRAVSANAISTTQSDGTTQNITASYSYFRLLENRWAVPFVAAYERNQSLGIQNRFLGAVGGGRWLIESNVQSLIVFAGVDVNQEDTTGTDGDQSSLETFFALRYSRNRYHHLKENFAVTLGIFPSITESGRIRSSLSAHWRQEFFVAYLYFELSVYAIYDRKPPAGALDTTDYGVVTSIGYSFSP
jgi:hypothetical protein